MKRIVFLLLIGLSGAVVAAQHIGAAQAPTPFAALFTNPDGSLCKMPCVLGLRLKETTKAEVLRLLATHSSTKQSRLSDLGRYVRLNGDLSVTVWFSDDQTVSTIDLTFTGKRRQTLATTIAALGTPDYIIINTNGGNDTTSYYRADKIVITFVRRNFPLYDDGYYEADGLWMNTDFIGMTFGLDVQPDTRAVKWAGFTSVSRYYNRNLRLTSGSYP